MDFLVLQQDHERLEFKTSALKIGFDEITAECTANVHMLQPHVRLSVLLMAWKKIGDYLTQNPYINCVGIVVKWIGRCTLDLWFGREWIQCPIEHKATLIEHMMKVYPAAYVTMHPYSWPYMFSIYVDPWMVEYLNKNFHRVSAPDTCDNLDQKDSEFVLQEGISLILLRIVKMFEFNMLKLVKHLCVRLLWVWEDMTSLAHQPIRVTPNSAQYIEFVRHVCLVAIYESNGVTELHYVLECIQRNLHCSSNESGPLERTAQIIARGLQETNKSVIEFLSEFILNMPAKYLNNIFGQVTYKYVFFITEYLLKKMHSLSHVDMLSPPYNDIYIKLVQLFIRQRESTEDLMKATAVTSEILFSRVYSLNALQISYEQIKQRTRSEWYTTKITLLLAIINEELNNLEELKYTENQKPEDLIQKEQELATFYRDLANHLSRIPYLEQEAWLTTFSLHPCKEYMLAVTKCGSRNLRAIKKVTSKFKKTETDNAENKKQHEISKNSVHAVPDNQVISTEQPLKQTLPIQNITDDTNTSHLVSVVSELSERPEEAPNEESNLTTDKSQKKLKKTDSTKNRNKKEIVPNLVPISKQGPSKLDTLKKHTGPKVDLKDKDSAEVVYAAAAGAADKLPSLTEDSLKYPAFAIVNSVTDTEDLIRYTNYDDEQIEQYKKLNQILLNLQINNPNRDDLLALIISPRYKRLTWTVCWKLLRKRCRDLLNKDKKKRQLVQQFMADANDRLTHLKIDYSKFKDKPQIDYGTIEGGYECCETDSELEPIKPVIVSNSNVTKETKTSVVSTRKNLKRKYTTVSVMKPTKAANKKSISSTSSSSVSQLPQSNIDKQIPTPTSSKMTDDTPINTKQLGIPEPSASSLSPRFSQHLNTPGPRMPNANGNDSTINTNITSPQVGQNVYAQGIQYFQVKTNNMPPIQSASDQSKESATSTNIPQLSHNPLERKATITSSTATIHTISQQNENEHSVSKQSVGANSSSTRTTLATPENTTIPQILVTLSDSLESSPTVTCSNITISGTTNTFINPETTDSCNKEDLINIQTYDSATNTVDPTHSTNTLTHTNVTAGINTSTKTNTTNTVSTINSNNIQNNTNTTNTMNTQNAQKQESEKMSSVLKETSPDQAQALILRRSDEDWSHHNKLSILPQTQESACLDSDDENATYSSQEISRRYQEEEKLDGEDDENIDDDDVDENMGTEIDEIEDELVLFRDDVRDKLERGSHVPHMYKQLQEPMSQHTIQQFQPFKIPDQISLRKHQDTEPNLVGDLCANSTDLKSVTRSMDSQSRCIYSSSLPSIQAYRMKDGSFVQANVAMGTSNILHRLDNPSHLDKNVTIIKPIDSEEQICVANINANPKTQKKLAISPMQQNVCDSAAIASEKQRAYGIDSKMQIMPDSLRTKINIPNIVPSITIEPILTATTLHSTTSYSASAVSTVVSNVNTDNFCKPSTSASALAEIYNTRKMLLKSTISQTSTTITSTSTISETIIVTESQPNKSHNTTCTAATIRAQSSTENTNAISSIINIEQQHDPQASSITRFTTRSTSPDNIIHDHGTVINYKLLDPHLKTYKNLRTIMKKCIKITDSAVVPTNEIDKVLQSTAQIITTDDKNVQTYNVHDDIDSDNLQDMASRDTHTTTHLLPICSNTRHHGVPRINFVQSEQRLLLLQFSELAALLTSGNIMKPWSNALTSALDHTSDIVINLNKLRGIFERLTIMHEKGIIFQKCVMSPQMYRLFMRARHIVFNMAYLQEKHQLVHDYHMNMNENNDEAFMLVARPDTSNVLASLQSASELNQIQSTTENRASTSGIVTKYFLTDSFVGDVVKLSVNETAGESNIYQALEKFAQNRYNAKSPTLYSPILSLKKLREGSLKEYIDIPEEYKTSDDEDNDDDITSDTNSSIRVQARSVVKSAKRRLSDRQISPSPTRKRTMTELNQQALNESDGTQSIPNQPDATIIIDACCSEQLYSENEIEGISEGEVESIEQSQIDTTTATSPTKISPLIKFTVGSHGSRTTPTSTSTSTPAPSPMSTPAPAPAPAPAPTPAPASTPSNRERTKAKAKAKVDGNYKLLRRAVFLAAKKRFYQFTAKERAALLNYSCRELKIQLTRLTVREAEMCRKPHVRLERSAIYKYLNNIRDKRHMRSTKAATVRIQSTRNSSRTKGTRRAAYLASENNLNLIVEQNESDCETDNATVVKDAAAGRNIKSKRCGKDKKDHEPSNKKIGRRNKRITGSNSNNETQDSEIEGNKSDVNVDEDEDEDEGEVEDEDEDNEFPPNNDYAVSNKGKRDSDDKDEDPCSSTGSERTSAFHSNGNTSARKQTKNHTTTDQNATSSSEPTTRTSEDHSQIQKIIAATAQIATNYTKDYELVPYAANHGHLYQLLQLSVLTRDADLIAASERLITEIQRFVVIGLQESPLINKQLFAALQNYIAENPFTIKIDLSSVPTLGDEAVRMLSSIEDSSGENLIQILYGNEENIRTINQYVPSLSSLFPLPSTSQDKDCVEGQSIELSQPNQQFEENTPNQDPPLPSLSPKETIHKTVLHVECIRSAQNTRNVYTDHNYCRQPLENIVQETSQQPETSDELWMEQITPSLMDISSLPPQSPTPEVALSTTNLESIKHQTDMFSLKEVGALTLEAALSEQNVPNKLASQTQQGPLDSDPQLNLNIYYEENNFVKLFNEIQSGHFYTSSPSKIEDECTPDQNIAGPVRELDKFDETNRNESLSDSISNDVNSFLGSESNKSSHPNQNAYKSLSNNVNHIPEDLTRSEKEIIITNTNKFSQPSTDANANAAVVLNAGEAIAIPDNERNSDICNNVRFAGVIEKSNTADRVASVEKDLDPSKENTAVNVSEIDLSLSWFSQSFSEIIPIDNIAVNMPSISGVQGNIPSTTDSSHNSLGSLATNTRLLPVNEPTDKSTIPEVKQVRSPPSHKSISSPSSSITNERSFKENTSVERPSSIGTENLPPTSVNNSTNTLAAPPKRKVNISVGGTIQCTICTKTDNEVSSTFRTTSSLSTLSINERIPPDKEPASEIMPVTTGPENQTTDGESSSKEIRERIPSTSHSLQSPSTTNQCSSNSLTISRTSNEGIAPINDNTEGSTSTMSTASSYHNINSMVHTINERTLPEKEDLNRIVPIEIRKENKMIETREERPSTTRNERNEPTCSQTQTHSTSRGTNSISSPENRSEGSGPVNNASNIASSSQNTRKSTRNSTKKSYVDRGQNTVITGRAARKESHYLKSRSTFLRDRLVLHEIFVRKYRFMTRLFCNAIGRDNRDRDNITTEKLPSSEEIDMQLDNVDKTVNNRVEGNIDNKQHNRKTPPPGVFHVEEQSSQLAIESTSVLSSDETRRQISDGNGQRATLNNQPSQMQPETAAVSTDTTVELKGNTVPSSSLNDCIEILPSRSDSTLNDEIVEITADVENRTSPIPIRKLRPQTPGICLRRIAESDSESDSESETSRTEEVAHTPNVSSCSSTHAISAVQASTVATISTTQSTPAVQASTVENLSTTQSTEQPLNIPTVTNNRGRSVETIHGPSTVRNLPSTQSTPAVQASTVKTHSSTQLPHATQPSTVATRSSPQSTHAVRSPPYRSHSREEPVYSRTVINHPPSIIQARFSAPSTNGPQPSTVATRTSALPTNRRRTRSMGRPLHFPPITATNRRRQLERELFLKQERSYIPTITNNRGRPFQLIPGTCSTIVGTQPTLVITRSSAQPTDASQPTTVTTHSSPQPTYAVQPSSTLASCSSTQSTEQPLNNTTLSNNHRQPYEERTQNENAYGSTSEQPVSIPQSQSRSRVQTSTQQQYSQPFTGPVDAANTGSGRQTQRPAFKSPEIRRPVNELSRPRSTATQRTPERGDRVEESSQSAEQPLNNATLGNNHRKPYQERTQNENVYGSTSEQPVSMPQSQSRSRVQTSTQQQYSQPFTGPVDAANTGSGRQTQRPAFKSPEIRRPVNELSRPRSTATQRTPERGDRVEESSQSAEQPLNNATLGNNHRKPYQERTQNENVYGSTSEQPVSMPQSQSRSRVQTSTQQQYSQPFTGPVDAANTGSGRQTQRPAFKSPQIKRPVIELSAPRSQPFTGPVNAGNTGSGRQTPRPVFRSSQIGRPVIELSAPRPIVTEREPEHGDREEEGMENDNHQSRLSGASLAYRALLLDFFISGDVPLPPEFEHAIPRAQSCEQPNEMPPSAASTQVSVLIKPDLLELLRQKNISTEEIINRFANYISGNDPLQLGAPEQPVRSRRKNNRYNRGRSNPWRNRLRRRGNNSSNQQDDHVSRDESETVNSNDNEEDDMNGNDIVIDVMEYDCDIDGVNEQDNDNDVDNDNVDNDNIDNDNVDNDNVGNDNVDNDNGTDSNVNNQQQPETLRPPSPRSPPLSMPESFYGPDYVHTGSYASFSPCSSPTPETKGLLHLFMD